MEVGIIIFFKFLWLDDHILETLISFRLLEVLVELNKLFSKLLKIFYNIVTCLTYPMIGTNLHPVIQEGDFSMYRQSDM